MKDNVLREQVVALLTGGEAHVKIKDAIDNVGAKFRNARPTVDVHSVWEELEHLRLAQEDILQYTINASWKSPKWPEGYWPSHTGDITDDQWQASVDAFLTDLEK